MGVVEGSSEGGASMTAVLEVVVVINSSSEFSNKASEDSCSNVPARISSIVC